MESSKINVWLDCDPGHDDMLAIILAAKHPRMNLLGISTSAGNSLVEYTTQNALNILHLINRADIPVIQGAGAPLLGKIETAAECHGYNGLEGAILDQSPQQAIVRDPYIEIYRRIMECPKKVYFVNTGSMTNLALLLRAFPEVLTKIQEISVMAGAIGLGNWSPAAEFNVLVDPLAAAIVFQSKIPIIMVPLEVTHTALITEDIFQAFKELPNKKLGSILYDLNRVFQKNYKDTQNFNFPPAHDPCAMFFLLEMEAFQGRKAFVSIDRYPDSYGRTNCAFRHPHPNTFVCEEMNIKRFWQVMLQALRLVA